MHAVRSRTRTHLVLAACLALVALSPAVAGFDERKTFDGDQLLIRNLIGRIDADEGNYSELIVEFPLDESRRFVYPELGRSTVKFGDDSGGGWLSGLFGSSRKLEVTGSGRGLEIWADATVKVPHGKTLKIDHGVGEIHATDVEASLDLACHTCPIEVVGLKGRVAADTGSGSVSLKNVRGDIAVDTGSGRVELQLPTDASARIVAETGSGGIHLDLDEGYALIEKEKDACELQLGGGDAVVRLDTGSGSIRISQ